MSRQVNSALVRTMAKPEWFVLAELVFIGLGLHDEYGMSLRGQSEAKSCVHLFAEFYTSVMPGLNLENLKKIVGKPVQVLSRLEIEERAEQVILLQGEGWEGWVSSSRGSHGCHDACGPAPTSAQGRDSNQRNPRGVGWVSGRRCNRAAVLQVWENCNNPCFLAGGIS